MKKFKDLYKNIEEAAEGIEGYPPGFNTGEGEKRRVDGDSFGGFRVGEGNTLSRINAFLNKYLAGSYLAGDHKLALRELRVRLNHIGLDFDSEKELVEGENRIKVKLHGDTFGTTPTTDLMKGFDHGEDLPSLTLMLNYNHDKNTEMCYMNGKIMLDNSVNEEQLDEFAPLIAMAARAAVSSAGSAIMDKISSGGKGKVAGSEGVGGVGGAEAGHSVGEDGKLSKRAKRIKNVGRLLGKKMGEGSTVYETKMPEKPKINNPYAGGPRAATSKPNPYDRRTPITKPSEEKKKLSERYQQLFVPISLQSGESTQLSPYEKAEEPVRYINNKKKLKEAAALLPVLIGLGRAALPHVARAAAPIVVGAVAKKLFGSQQSSSSDTTIAKPEDKPEPPVQPYSLSGVSHLGKYKSGAFRKSRRGRVVSEGIMDTVRTAVKSTQQFRTAAKGAAGVIGQQGRQLIGQGAMNVAGAAFQVAQGQKGQGTGLTSKLATSFGRSAAQFGNRMGAQAPSNPSQISPFARTIGSGINNLINNARERAAANNQRIQQARNKSGGRESVHAACHESRTIIRESKDEPRVVEHFIMRNKDIKDKVLIPIYNTLKKLKEKNKYNRDTAAKHLYYVVNYAIRKLNSGDKKVTLSQIEKARVVNDLLRNFEKSFK